MIKTQLVTKSDPDEFREFLKQELGRGRIESDFRYGRGHTFVCVKLNRSPTELQEKASVKGIHLSWRLSGVELGGFLPGKGGYAESVFSAENEKEGELLRAVRVFRPHPRGIKAIATGRKLVRVRAEAKVNRLVERVRIENWGEAGTGFEDLFDGSPGKFTEDPKLAKFQPAVESVIKKVLCDNCTHLHCMLSYGIDEFQVEDEVEDQGEV